MKGLSTHGISRLMEKANLPPEVYNAEQLAMYSQHISTNLNIYN